MKNFKDRIKDLREEHNLTQTELANLIGINQGTIAKWENGIRIPSADSIIILAKFFKCTSDYLLGLEDF